MEIEIHSNDFMAQKMVGDHSSIICKDLIINKMGLHHSQNIHPETGYKMNSHDGVVEHNTGMICPPDYIQPVHHEKIYDYPGGQIFVNEIDESHCKVDVLNNGSNLADYEVDFDHGPKHIDLEHGGSIETYKDSEGCRHIKVHTDNNYLGDNTSNDYDINIDKNSGGHRITDFPVLCSSNQSGFELVF